MTVRSQPTITRVDQTGASAPTKAIHGLLLLLDVDGADATVEPPEGDRAAATALALVTDGAHGTLLLLGFTPAKGCAVWRARLALPDLVRRVVALAHEFGASLVAVEGVAGFKGYADAIRAIAGRAVRVYTPPVKGDKWVRSQPLANAIASGYVRVPDTRPPWLRPFLDELLSFPAGAHDDQVDACAMAFNLAALGRPVLTRRHRAAVRARLLTHLPFGA